MINIRTIRKLQDNDGLTLKDGNIKNYKTGWQVADYGNKVTSADEVMKIVKEYNGNCGIWYSEGIYYVDHSIRVDTKKEAMKIGKEYHQISIWNWKLQKLEYC